MNWHIADSAQPKKVILMCSKESHCVADLLHRWHSKEINAEIVAVISNHDDLREYVEWHGIEYVHIPVRTDSREAAFNQIRSVIAEKEADTIVLARYMQIIPPELCEEYAGRMINIHHSFLPSFAGAQPYQQAAERGVKLIGATCHYVTSELDAGPIIEQDVARVNHHNTVSDMVRMGRDVEKTVLARGLRYHLEDRVFIHGNKTVVFG